MPVIAALIFVAVAGFALIAFRKSSGEAAEADCRAKQKRLTSGGITDPSERARLEADVRLCAASLQAQGIAVDMSAIALANARNTAAEIDIAWSNYQGTDYADTIKRGDIRNNMGRLQDQIRQNLIDAAREATNEAQRAVIREEIQRQILASLRRADCYQSGAQGCGRSGAIEGDWDERTRDEIQHGALALGLRTGLETGWRTPRDLGEPRDVAAWAAWNRSQASGNVVPASLYRIGELGRVLTPTWDDFGGGPHYPGQRATIQATWEAGTGGTSPYDMVKPLAAVDFRRRLDFGALRVGG